MKFGIAYVLILLLRVYKWTISPMLGNNCRFYPSCSEYAMEAIRERGALKGVMLAAVRLCKCHPWHPGGHDPVPKQPHGTTSSTSACGCRHP